MSAVLADPWAELREAIRNADVVHADETTWRLQGAQQWLWVAASPREAIEVGSVSCLPSIEFSTTL